MLASGARSYLVKDASIEEIVEAIARSAGGDASLSGAVTEHVVAELGSRLAGERTAARERREARERIQRFIHGAPELAMVYQPIVELASGRIVGLEALARFHGEPARSPDAWFVEAAEVGLSAQLQATALRKALLALDRLPLDIFLSVNVDPTDMASRELLGVLEECPAERIVIELTEHSAASDYPRLRDALDPLRHRLEAGGGRCGRGILELPAHPRARAGHHQARHQHRAERRPGTVPSGAPIRIGRLRERNRQRPDRGRGRDGRGGTRLASLGIPLIQGYLAARPGPIPESFAIPLTLLYGSS